MVQVSPQLGASRAQRLAEVGGIDILRRSIMAELDRRGRLNAASEHTVLVVVSGFRLRSTATSLWLGVMAGSDSLQLSAQVFQHEQEVNTFETAVSAIKGGVLAPSASGRFNCMAAVAAERLADRMFLK